MIRLGVVAATGALVASLGGSFGNQAPGAASCIPVRYLDDTMRFVGIARSEELPPGALRMWVDTSGHLRYSQTWARDSFQFLWEGTIRGTSSEPTGYLQWRIRNGAESGRESVERNGDSLVTVRGGNRQAVAVDPGSVAVPGYVPAPVRMVLLHCAAIRPGATMQTSRYGQLRSQVVATVPLREGLRTTRAQLRLLRNSANEVLARAWFDAGGKVIAYPSAEGVMDLIDPLWVSSRDRLVEAELRASSPNCRSGFGPGSCEPGPRVCNLPTSTRTPDAPVRTVVVSDSDYSVRSDGRGAYVAGSGNVLVPPVGVVAGLLLVRSSPNARGRAFLVDLSKPVPGDIGRPLGVVTSDGTWPGDWAPSGASYLNELAAHADTDWDQRQHSLAAMPIGSSSPLKQLTIDFYINGVLHLLQMGPQPAGHCYAAGTAVYGDGTTMATVSRPDSTRWVIDLPPGSKGRLFRNAHGDPTAVNLGLYYVSLRMVVQK